MPSADKARIAAVVGDVRVDPCVGRGDEVHRHKSPVRARRTTAALRDLFRNKTSIYTDVIKGILCPKLWGGPYEDGFFFSYCNLIYHDKRKLLRGSGCPEACLSTHSTPHTVVQTREKDEMICAGSCKASEFYTGRTGGSFLKLAVMYDLISRIVWFEVVIKFSKLSQRQMILTEHLGFTPFSEVVSALFLASGSCSILVRRTEILPL